MVFLIDMDGVLADFVGGVDEGLKKIGITPLPPEQMTGYHFEVYPEGVLPIINQIYSTPGFFDGLKPLPGALQGFRALIERGIIVRICSTPLNGSDARCIMEKSSWIERHLGSDFVRSAYFPKDKTHITGTILLDDKPEVTGEQKPSWKHIVYDQPYNRHVNGSPRFTWSDGIDKLMALAN